MISGNLNKFIFNGANSSRYILKDERQEDMTSCGFSTGNFLFEFTFCQNRKKFITTRLF
ncbi:hypothetical protein CLLU_30470 [Clostridium luticellarii]|uniref:Uncharacterized protein n=1 Tax=Clostridium luticellarii TaxID=1691940 RepID=A0A2T0BCW9_9CLOT|nr:hypothetical protein CLLU_30470 [Clostridium luticellarii]